VKKKNNSCLENSILNYKWIKKKVKIFPLRNFKLYSAKASQNWLEKKKKDSQNKILTDFQLPKNWEEVHFQMNN